MDYGGVLMPRIHKHLMIPINDWRRGDCCGHFEPTSDGYYCQLCDYFVHKSCAESSESIQHLSHPGHILHLGRNNYNITCNLCGIWIQSLFYRCEICNFNIDLYCSKYPPPEVIDISESHHHKLTLLKERIEFECDAKCGYNGFAFPYKCHECDLAFHVDCVWYPSNGKHSLELKHSYHSLHPLKLHAIGQLPDNSDRQCRLCSRKVNEDRMFYHCSPCNFTLDMRCLLFPPLQSLLHLKAHDHQLTLLPRLDSFTCNACGLKGERSPYICVQCGFMIHLYCLDLPHVININRHDHRVYRTSILGILNSVCGVCHQKVDRTCGGFMCKKCPRYVVHSKCATREDVWNGEELEGIPEETEDIEPFVVIDDNTILHFSHKAHPLRLHVNGDLCDNNKRCRACTHPICLQSFYGCKDCDFILHQTCAGFLRKKRHFLHNERLTLVTDETDHFDCGACSRLCNGFRYQDRYHKFDVRCASISEPFLHPSHPDHPLYYASPDKYNLCNCCNKVRDGAYLRCIEDDCGFALCFKCITLPLAAKHRVDDHPLSLCYGENEKGNDKCWCDICEKEVNPNKWFYSCKDHRAVLHKKCVIGDYSHLMPRSTITRWEKYYEVVLNNSVSRPICSCCNLHCIYPIMLKKLGALDEYFCSHPCWLRS